MKVAFIIDKQHSVHNLGAEWIFVLCNKDIEIESIFGNAKVVNLNDLKICENTAKIISLALRYFADKLVGFIKYGDWLAEQRFASIIPKPNLLIILADAADVDVDGVVSQFHNAVEELNIPIVFYNKNSGEYAVFGVGYEIEDGFFHFCI